MATIAKFYDEDKRLAVLIDADNAQPAIVEGLFEEIAKYGISSIRRIYGDWTTPQLQSWKEYLHSYAITPIQQFCYTSKKNATDSALIIDAMDILHTGNMNGFCIVSSDSDFTRLASRIRESGLEVYGFGEQKTPKAFREACNKFTYTEILRKENETKNKDKLTKEKPLAVIKDKKDDEKLLLLIKNTIEDSSDEEGWANLGLVAQNLQKKMPDFDSRNYGCKKFLELTQKFPRSFETKNRASGNSGGQAVYIKNK